MSFDISQIIGDIPDRCTECPTLTVVTIPYSDGPERFCYSDALRHLMREKKEFASPRRGRRQ